MNCITHVKNYVKVVGLWNTKGKNMKRGKKIKNMGGGEGRRLTKNELGKKKRSAGVEEGGVQGMKR